jgi:hypothetical protein
MPSHDEFPFRRLPATPLIVWSRVKPLIQRGEVDFEDEDAVEQLDELREVPRATAEEAMNGVMSTALQFIANGGLAGP